jgi:soluble lytic murein transglycosylase-like protein
MAYLSYLRDKYNQSHRYLAAYNMGPTKFNRMIRSHSPHPVSVSRYVKNIHSGVYEIRREAQQLVYAQ